MPSNAADRNAEAASRSALVVGSAMIDTVTLIAPDNIERVSMQNRGSAFLLLEEGLKVTAQTIETHVGGGGCNSAVCLARRGWRTALLAKTGADAGAARVRAHLEAEGVATDHLRMAQDEATGSAVLVASHDRNAAVFVSRGANGALRATDFDDALFETCDLLYIAPLSSRSADCFPHLVEQGRWAGAFVAANPGIRQLTSRGDAIFSAIGNITLLSLNARESAALGPALEGRGLIEAAGKDAAAVSEDAPPLLRRGLAFGGHHIRLLAFFDALHGLGAKWISVTDGADGAFLSCDGPDGPRQVLFCPAHPSEAATTAGAGDAFSATLASELALGADPGAALARAAANAASVVEQLNTTDGLLDAEALLATPPAPGLRALLT